MDQLIKRMLAVGSRFAPVNGAGIAGDFASIKRDAFAVAFHCQLLEVSRESLQVLLVRKDREVSALKKSVYQTANSPMRTGRLRSKGAVRNARPSGGIR